MKTIRQQLNYCFLIAILIMLPFATFAQYAGGSGTASAPYLISNAEQLVYMRNQINNGTGLTGYYKLTADIDLSTLSNYDGWIPIGTSTNPFRGYFDGGGFAIRNLRSGTATGATGGLFGYISDAKGATITTTIKDLALTNVEINTTASSIGGLINQIYLSVGNGPTTSFSLEVTNCSVDGNIYAGSDVGGLIGSLVSTSNNQKSPFDIRITGCNTTGNVIGSGSNVGGIVGNFDISGKNYSVDQVTSIFSKCSSSSVVEGATNVGGIAGNTSHGIGGVIIADCDAMNPTITATEENGKANRIAGNSTGDVTYENNHAGPNTKVIINGEEQNIPNDPNSPNGDDQGSNPTGYTGTYVYYGTGNTIQFDGNDWIDTSNNNKVGPLNDFISVTVRNAIVELNHNKNFYGGSIILEEGASLVVNQGSVSATEAIHLFLSGDYSADPLMVGNIVCDGMMTVTRSYPANKWSHIAFPFGVDYITDSSGNILTMGDAETDGDYYLSYYDGAGRAANGKTGNWMVYKVDENLLKEDQPSIIKADKGMMIFPDNEKYPSGYVTFTFVALSLTFDEIVDPIWELSDKRVPVTPHLSESVYNQGWNYISNPYSINYKTGGMGDYICYIYNEAENNYEAYSPDDNYALAPSRPFFIQVDNATDTIAFSAVSTALRSASVGTERREEVRLQISDGTLSDQFRVVMRDDATNGYDLNKDAVKINKTPAKATIYSPYSGTNLVINAIPFDDGNEVRIPLTYYVPKAGNYTLSYIPKEERSPNIKKLLLVDKATGNAVDLLGSNPTSLISSTKEETVENRFELRMIVEQSSTEQKQPSSEEFNVVSGKGNFTFSGLNSAASVRLYDLAGRLVAVYTDIENNQPVATSLRGAYIMNISTGNKTVVKKIIL